METRELDYELPRELIAQHPLAARSASRMLVVDRESGTWSDRRFRELPRLVCPGDCLAVNNSRVLSARLFGRRQLPSGELGARVELLLLSPEAPRSGRWRALARPGRRLRPGAWVAVGDARARVVRVARDGERIVEFAGLDAEGVQRLLQRHGHVPLPPYIRRSDAESDRERYQTVFATAPGSVAAPTAGLHFDHETVSAARSAGATVAEITLHVGPGTFRPVSAERVEDHRMHSEWLEIRQEAAAALQSALRVLAVGTTTVRALEAAARRHGGSIRPWAGSTDLFIRPGYRFRAVDALLTNFHLPRSTLLMLVAAFAGADLVLEAYRHAVRERYRFYSYGDCMLIL